MKALILANGDPPSPQHALAMAQQHTLLLATDGAAHKAVLLGIVPHIICGDFDSVRLEEAHRAFPEAEFIPTPDQDRADLEKAVQLAFARGATHVTVMGALGGRIDHTLANLALLIRYPYLSLQSLSFVEERSSVIAIVGQLETPEMRELTTVPGNTLSLISLDGKAHVTLSGVKWPLHQYPLPVGTQGVSNVAESDTVRIEVCGGAVLVCQISPLF
jgi:thiamine pyrophosphokinase